MKQLSDRELKDLLTPHQRPEPPAGLAERIKREIPADLPRVDPMGSQPSVTPKGGRRNTWLMAASIVVALGGGFLAFRLMEQMPAPGEAPTVISDMAENPVRSGTSGSDAYDIAESSDTHDSTAKQSGEQAVGRGVPVESVEGAEVAETEIAGELIAPRPTAPSRDGVTRGSLGDEGAARDPGATGTDRDGLAAQVTPPSPKAKAPADKPLRGELQEQARTELQRQLRTPPPPTPTPSPGRPAAITPPPAPTEQVFYDSIDSEVAQTGGLSAEAGSGRSSETIAPKPARPTRSSGDTGRPIPPRASVPPPRAKATTAPPPRPKAREKKKADVTEEPQRSLADVGASGNLSVEHSNARIATMEREARQLETELKALEQSSVTRPSTGGTAEPNNAPYGDVFFDSAGTNPFIDTEDDALSTFGLDVDTGSYTVARRYLRDGHLPPPEAVRVEEFINYFDYGDAAPTRQEFAIHAEGAPSIYGQGERYNLLRFNLSGRELQEAQRRPALLTFVIDVSGSMGRENRLGLVKQALALLIDQLRPDDRLALVIYGSRGQVVLHPTGDHGAIRRAIDRLTTGGSTNAEEGLALAYELAANHRRRGAINRVILCSDGVANVGATSHGSILERIRREADQGIELTTVGFGMGNYNDVLMEQLADTGNGRYAYVDNLDEARRIFVENLTGTLQTLAAEARAQVDFDPSVVARYRLLGYENRDIADHRFRDDTVDAGEIGVGHTVTALYEIKTHRALRAGDRVATLHLRYGSVDRGEMVELERVVTGADFASRWQAASRALKLTTLVAEYAEILKRAYWAREGDLEDVFRRAQRLSAQWQGDREVADFVSLVGRAAEYRRLQDRQRQDR